MNPGQLCASGSQVSTLSYPDKGWEVITKAYVTTSDVPQFNVGHIVEYFITRTVCDSLPAADFKSMNRAAENLFRCGHVKNIKICHKNDFLFVKKVVSMK